MPFMQMEATEKEDSDERNDNTFVFFAGRLWKAAAHALTKEKE